METLTRYDGNDKLYTTDLPTIVIQETFNDVAMAHLIKNTGIPFQVNHYGWMVGHPVTANQIALLLVTYNFSFRYYDNADYDNTLFLKSYRPE
jgi:hypothetical protein